MKTETRTKRTSVVDTEGMPVLERTEYTLMALDFVHTKPEAVRINGKWFTETNQHVSGILSREWDSLEE